MLYIIKFYHAKFYVLSDLVTFLILLSSLLLSPLQHITKAPANTPMKKDKKIVNEKGTVVLQLIKETFTSSRFWYANINTIANSRSSITILPVFISIILFLWLFLFERYQCFYQGQFLVALLLPSVQPFCLQWLVYTLRSYFPVLLAVL